MDDVRGMWKVERGKRDDGREIDIQIIQRN
jgi:hypothetical protein